MLSLTNLEAVRGLMAEELDHDLAGQVMYRSPRLTDDGWQQYPALLREAISHHDDAWLADELNGRGFIEQFELRRKPKGGFSQAKVPFTAAATLAEGEFNRFYARAVCRYAIAQGDDEVTIYRAKQVAQPRMESELRIGKKISAAALLDDLRRLSPSEVETALGVPAGPNSGVSVRWP